MMINANEKSLSNRYFEKLLYLKDLFRYSTISQTEKEIANKLEKLECGRCGQVFFIQVIDLPDSDELCCPKCCEMKRVYDVETVEFYPLYQ
jgi:late competence protein required for DNA uptake (superfamily II DNA/RNA helicase)